MTSNGSAALSNHTAENYNTHAKFAYSAQNIAPVLNLLNAQPGEKIIDLGCGTGEITALIKKAVGPDGHVWGVDSSASMLEKAKGNAPGVNYCQADIQNLKSSLDPSLEGTFDAVFTSATLHWCKSNPVGVIDGIIWLLKPGGRLALEFGGFGNGVGVRAALHEVLRRKGIDPLPRDPWFFPTAEQYRRLITSRGLISDDLQLVPRPTPLTTDLFGWLATFARRTFFVDFPDQVADDLMHQVEEMCRPDAFRSNKSPGVGIRPEGSGSDEGESGWELMYIRLRGTATKMK